MLVSGSLVVPNNSAASVSIHPGQLAAESSSISQASVLNQLRNSGKPDAIIAAKLISRGSEKGGIDLVINTTAKTKNAGIFRFGDNKVTIYTQNINGAEAAAGVAGHETKHFLQKLSSRTYHQGHEYESFVLQSNIDSSFPLQTHEAITDFIQTNYRSTRRAPSNWQPNLNGAFTVDANGNVIK